MKFYEKFREIDAKANRAADVLEKYINIAGVLLLIFVAAKFYENWQRPDFHQHYQQHVCK